MSWFSKPKSFIGIDIGAGGVKLVELRKEKNRPVLFTYGYTAEYQGVHELVKNNAKKLEIPGKKKMLVDAKMFTEERMKAYANNIARVCREAKTVSKTAVVSLPVSSVFHVVVTLPKLDKDEFNLVLKAEIKKLLPQPIESMALDYQILPGQEGDKNQRVLVNAVPRLMVDFYSAVFQKAGLVLDSLEPESTALTRSLVGKDPATCLIIDIGAERTNFFINDQGFPITHHTIETGGHKVDKLLQNALGVDKNVVEQIKHDVSMYAQIFPERTNGKFMEIIAPVVDPIIKEIEYSMDLFVSQSGYENRRPEKIILTGGASLLPNLSEYIANKFKLKCYVGDPWARVVYQDALKPVLNTIGPRMSVAIGLALRNVIQ
ncbi:type IV pilus assembly protein PilM [Patescibacteria group bacterium]|nr:type IV pilus assembly protein PilM [Patescibacteria group bacterium]